MPSVINKHIIQYLLHQHLSYKFYSVQLSKTSDFRPFILGILGYTGAQNTGQSLTVN